MIHGIIPIQNEENLNVWVRAARKVKDLSQAKKMERIAIFNNQYFPAKIHFKSLKKEENFSPR